LLAAAAAFAGTFTYTVEGQTTLMEAPAGFDNQTNGYLDQLEFNADLAAFEERDTIEDGLGPVYNAQSCAECHQNPVTGGSSQITELRAGHLSYGTFVPARGGSLINDRAIDARIQEFVERTENITALRVSTNVLGLGFVEAVPSQTLIDLANAQPGMTRTFAGIVTNLNIHGQALQVHVLEGAADGRIGRFGWKDQHGSLLSFSADAYLNEVGITSRLVPDENTYMNESVQDYDTVPDPEDTENDIDKFAAFMRATKVPPRDEVAAATPEAQTGSVIFNQLGCNACHTRRFTTSTPGTLINDDQFKVTYALGNKIIHPFSDFLLHDVGTGDGIVQGDAPGNKMRTVPLWGLRTHGRHMHDGLSMTVNDAIKRHGGEATTVINQYKLLTGDDRRKLLAFLDSL
jgi:CxxC motif-containing protein (DUF1111 family)